MMKDEILKKLKEDEELLFYGVSDVSKTSKQNGRFLLAIVILIIFWICFIVVVRRQIRWDDRILASLLALIILTILVFYGIIYNNFLKNKNVNSEYFVTNQRIIVYNASVGFSIGNIFDISNISISREKNNYGDVLFILFRNSSNGEKSSNKICFEGVENPRKIVDIICNINSNIRIFDDRPTIMGKKI